MEDQLPLAKSRSERRLVILIEARRAERIIKLHWLRCQEAAVYRFLQGIRAEVRELKHELHRIDD